MLLYSGTVPGLVHLALSQMTVLQELARAGDHPGCPLLRGETETAWTRSVLLSVGRYKSWLHKQPPCLSLLCALLKQSLIVVRETRTTYAQPLASSGSGQRVEKFGTRMSC